MLKQFEKYIQEHSLIDSNEKVLLAISGGIDSVVMSHLFAELGKFDFAIAHCNFQLRGKESNKDEIFVQDLAKKLSCEFFNTHFDTSGYAASNSISIQMAARELRYKWFAEIADKHRYDKIAVAHNRNDVVETVLLNLVRGTGLKGLTGIKAKSGRVIRPLLYADRDEIAKYAEANKISYREDKSNSDTKYKRNFLRHEIIPLLQKINPSFNDTIIEETEIFESVQKIYSGELQVLKDAIIVEDKNRTQISITKLKSLKITPAVLYDILQNFGFSYPTIKDIYNALNAESGKRFLSDNYVLLKDRYELIIEARMGLPTYEEVTIRENDCKLSKPINLSISTIGAVDLTLPRSNNKIAIDKDKISFPLIIRRWQHGDYFFPLGMKGRKKLSDFFIDRKVDRLEKENIWVLTCDDQIVWLVGYQIDDRYKITESTTEVLLLERKN